ncbi:hypothetical protein [Haloarchaeobius salinus]|uniref:hypothetical protein n=1 Tax=Haloarchaeobius salinus TaxID=1198298 RepID=UPI00210C56A0|nr:hypothetical protein [Haloarchaeobius salinus]
MAVAETLVVCAAAGLAGALVMDVPMALLSEGFTPASVAASKLQRRPVEEVSTLAAQVVHHATGLVGGLGLGVAVVALEPRLGTWAAVVLPATVLTVFVMNLFGFVVLPTAGFDEDRRETTFLQWTFSAVVYGVVLTTVALFGLGA